MPRASLTPILCGHCLVSSADAQRTEGFPSYRSARFAPQAEADSVGKAALPTGTTQEVTLEAGLSSLSGQARRSGVDPSPNGVGDSENNERDLGCYTRRNKRKAYRKTRPWV